MTPLIAEKLKPLRSPFASVVCGILAGHQTAAAAWQHAWPMRHHAETAVYGRTGRHWHAVTCPDKRPYTETQGDTHRLRPTTLRLEPELVESITESARSAGVTRQEWMARALREALCSTR